MNKCINGNVYDYALYNIPRQCTEYQAKYAVCIPRQVDHPLLAKICRNEKIQGTCQIKA